jgi:hypothetical protein
MYTVLISSKIAVMKGATPWGRVRFVTTLETLARSSYEGSGFFDVK